MKLQIRFDYGKRSKAWWVESAYPYTVRDAEITCVEFEVGDEVSKLSVRELLKKVSVDISFASAVHLDGYTHILVGVYTNEADAYRESKRLIDNWYVARLELIESILSTDPVDTLNQWESGAVGTLQG